jgi:hypothetical protein
MKFRIGERRTRHGPIDLVSVSGKPTGDASQNFGAEGVGPPLYFTDPEGNVIELKGPSAPATSSLRKEGVMPAQPKVMGPASYFPSIEKKYGKPIDHWLKVLGGAGPLKHMELVALLKADHAMGHGHANALVAHYLAKRR